MASYPPSTMLQPVNLMGNVAPRQMQQQLSGNVMDLHQRASPKASTPTTMPSQQQIMHQQRSSHSHQMQQPIHSMDDRQQHEGQQQMQSSQHHSHGSMQHVQMSHSQVPITTSSSNHNTQQIHFKQENPAIANSPQQNCQVQQLNVHAESPHASRLNQEMSDNIQEIENVKTEEVHEEVITEEMHVMEIVEASDSHEVDNSHEDDMDENATKLMVEESEVDDSADDEDENDENSSGKTPKKFKCNVCPKRFTRKNTLMNHLRIHNRDEGKSEGEEGAFSCPQCPKTFVDKYHLNRHQKTHDSKVFSCELCRFDFYVKREYNRHMKIHAGVKTFLCSACSKTFTDKVKFNRHMRAHEGIKPFQCNVCGESFTQRSNLNIHLRIHDGIRPFQCNVCYICFTNKSDLNRHSRIHNGIKPFLCSMCAKCFSRKDDLNRHMKIHEGSKRYLCTMCPKCFTRKDDLNRHLRNHDGLKPFHCTVCFESFTQKALLNIHLRIHTNSKPHTCSICSESFSQQSNLHIHLKLNHGVNPFKCEQCPNETFEKETQLSLHLRTAHGDKPFKCSMCEDGFGKKSDMKEHLRAAHNVNPFKCDICFKCFSKKSNLRTHIKMHEPIPCDKCPEVFEKKSDLQEHVDKCHNLNNDEEEDDLFDKPKEKSFNCSQCLSVVRMPYEIKVELPFVCITCSGENKLAAREKLKSFQSSSKSNKTSEKFKEKRRSAGKGNKSLFECQLCEKSFRYRLPLVKHCKKLHNVHLDSGSEDEAKSSKSTTSTLDTRRVKKESIDTTQGSGDLLADLDLSGPMGEFKCALCDKIFVRKATLDRHVTVHGISAAEHDEIMGRDTSAVSGDSMNQSLVASESEENIPEIDVNKSDKDNVYIVTPKNEPNCVVKEEIISDYEDNDNSMMASTHDDDDGFQTPSDDEDEVPLSKRSFLASSAYEIIPRTPKKRGRPKGVPNRRKSAPKKVPKSDAETTDYEGSVVDTDYVNEDCSRNGESEVEGKENEYKKRRGRRKTSDGQSEFPCSDCGKVFTRKTTLKRHIRIHIGIKEFQCWICSKCFMEKSHLSRHLRKHEGVSESMEAQAPYCCSICERKFTIKGQLSRHLKAHENEKPDTPQTCEICQKSFDKKAKFKRHMKVHDGVRDHQCQVCGNRFKQKSNLNIHMKIHEGIKAHQCNVCMMKFTNKSDLNRHMRKHDGVKPFLCSICAKNFSRKDDLNRHMRKHDGIKPFLCSMCADAFSRKDHLKKHMRKCYGPPTGEYKPRKRVRKNPLTAREEGVLNASMPVSHNGMVSQDLSVREPPQYRPGGVVNSVSAHAQQVLQASVGQAAASGLFWCAAQYYTNPPAIEFAPKPEYYA